MTRAEWDAIWQRFHDAARTRGRNPNKAITEADARMEQHRHGPRPPEETTK